MFNINSVIDRTLIYFPIFKILTSNIHFIENNSMATACTTGNTIYYNSSFFQTLSKDEQVFIIAHELMHITLKHLSRVEDRNMEIWNYSTDAVINQILKKNGLPLVEGVIDCPDALSFSAEEYYEIVKNRPDCEELMAKYRHDKQESIIATHEHWNEECSEDLTEDLPDINEHNITEINKKLIQDDNQEYVKGVQEEETTSSRLGSVGNTSPIIDWKSFLQRKKKKVFSADYNLHNGFFDEEGIYKYPYELIRKSNIEILIDTSGSVDDKLVKAFLQECKNIFDDYIIKVGCFDTKFYGFHEVQKREDLDNFVIEGRGGTNFSTAVNSFSRKASIKIIFTDGYAEMPQNDRDVIWVVYGNDKINSPGGKVFYVDPNTLTLKGKSR
jgi:predicted metal-dependent peptidase